VKLLLDDGFNFALSPGQGMISSNISYGNILKTSTRFKEHEKQFKNYIETMC